MGDRSVLKFEDQPGLGTNSHSLHQALFDDAYSLPPAKQIQNPGQPLVYPADDTYMGFPIRKIPEGVATLPPPPEPPAPIVRPEFCNSGRKIGPYPAR
jgi:hypothetical protein